MKPSSFNSSKKELGNFSNTQSVDITVGETSMMKKPNPEGRLHSIERKSFVYSA